MAEVKIGQQEQPQLDAREAMEEEYFELLPVEKKLIGYSLGLGLILLVIFIFTFGVFK
ncbi:hypothetical protein [Desulfofundulus thermocisternus]|uniref:hypothetical protein n=1 Tax=Desulfofundulus thermocisternus TaxID=42471 RepID=UPI0019EAE533|nr:hypothetical protein [Desulfofundulus thermocisternus]MBE3585882.1 hypothetical protein [Thermoanaerobacter sp.]MCS5696419.1 hypothetical protein [Desulfofundulus thermocisternus]